MSDILLKGHHVKNLRQSLHTNSDFSYSQITNNPEANITIVAGEVDIDCRDCGSLDNCLSEGKIFSLSSRIYDKMLAISSGTRVGKTYKSSDLIEILRNQNNIKYFFRDAGMMLLYIPVLLTVGAYEEIKTQVKSS